MLIYNLNLLQANFTKKILRKIMRKSHEIYFAPHLHLYQQNLEVFFKNGPNLSAANALIILQCEKGTVKYTSADKHLLCLQHEHKGLNTRSHLTADCLSFK